MCPFAFGILDDRDGGLSVINPLTTRNLCRRKLVCQRLIQIKSNLCQLGTKMTRKDLHPRPSCLSPPSMLPNTIDSLRQGCLHNQSGPDQVTQRALELTVFGSG